MFCLAILIGCFGFTIYQHEQLHVINNSKVGANTHIGFSNYDGLPTIATFQDSKPVRDMTNLEVAQSYNEAINYNLTPPLFGIMTIMLLGFVYLGNKIGENKHE